MATEYYKFSNKMSPEHNVKLAFTRMLAGGMDCTPGGFNNVTAAEFKQQIPTVVADTRAAELAKFVVYESPYTVVADHPKHILGQQGADFLKIVPTVWDNIKFLGGSPTEYVATVKQPGSNWFIGVLNNSTEREISLNTGFYRLENIRLRYGQMSRMSVRTRRISKRQAKPSKSVSP
jgi:alpha-glucosidase